MEPSVKIYNTEGPFQNSGRRKYAINRIEAEKVISDTNKPTHNILPTCYRVTCGLVILLLILYIPHSRPLYGYNVLLFNGSVGAKVLSDKNRSNMQHANTQEHLSTPIITNKNNINNSFPTLTTSYKKALASSASAIAAALKFMKDCTAQQGNYYQHEPVQCMALEGAIIWSNKLYINVDANPGVIMYTLWYVSEERSKAYRKDPSTSNESESSMESMELSPLQREIFEALKLNYINVHNITRQELYRSRNKERPSSLNTLYKSHGLPKKYPFEWRADRSHMKPIDVFWVTMTGKRKASGECGNNIPPSTRIRTSTDIFSEYNVNNSPIDTEGYKSCVLACRTIPKSLSCLSSVTALFPHISTFIDQQTGHRKNNNNNNNNNNYNNNNKNNSKNDNNHYTLIHMGPANTIGYYQCHIASADYINMWHTIADYFTMLFHSVGNIIKGAAEGKYEVIWLTRTPKGVESHKNVCYSYWTCTGVPESSEEEMYSEEYGETEHSSPSKESGKGEINVASDVIHNWNSNLTDERDALSQTKMARRYSYRALPLFSFFASFFKRNFIFIDDPKHVRSVVRYGCGDPPYAVIPETEIHRSNIIKSTFTSTQHGYNNNNLHHHSQRNDGEQKYGGCRKVNITGNYAANTTCHSSVSLEQFPAIHLNILLLGLKTTCYPFYSDVNTEECRSNIWSMRRYVLRDMYGLDHNKRVSMRQRNAGDVGSHHGHRENNNISNSNNAALSKNGDKFVNSTLMSSVPPFIVHIMSRQTQRHRRIVNYNQTIDVIANAISLYFNNTRVGLSNTTSTKNKMLKDTDIITSSHAVNYKLAVVQLHSGMSFREQVLSIYNSSMLIAGRGAGTALSVFLPIGSGYLSISGRDRWAPYVRLSLWWQILHHHSAKFVHCPRNQQYLWSSGQLGNQSYYSHRQVNRMSTNNACYFVSSKDLNQSVTGLLSAMAERELMYENISEHNMSLM